MADLYTQSFAVVHGQVGDTSPYVVPAGYRWVIRDVACWNGNLAVVVAASITTVDATTIVQCNASESIGQWYFHQECRLVIPDGEFFQLHADFAVDWMVSGYQLLLP